MKNFKKFSLLSFFLLAFVSAPFYVNAMHIAEGYLPVKWAIIWFIVAAPFFIMGLINLKKIFKEQPNKKMLVALVGAFVFVLSALKIPSLTGSCSHPTGIGLGAILFGPTIMAVLGVIVLLFQAILLAHGGLTTLGANTFSMAIVGAFVSYFIYKLCKKAKVKPAVGVFLAAALGDLLTYVTTSIQIALAHPDPVNGVMASVVKYLQIFALTQVPLAIAEGILTAIVFNLLVEYRKEGSIDEII